jgi:catechol 2,3-dioxygenase-like lactoylglutathione lyase family enzyme
VPRGDIFANLQPGKQAIARAGEPHGSRTFDDGRGATVFVVRDITKSIEHYRDALGFSVTFQYGNPTFYACLCRDEVALHLLAAHETKRLPGNGGICVFVKDVDRVHADLTSRGANVIKAPQNYDYGMRDFDVVDPDGNHLTFGMESLSPS